MLATQSRPATLILHRGIGSR